MRENQKSNRKPSKEGSDVVFDPFIPFFVTYSSIPALTFYTWVIRKYPFLNFDWFIKYTNPAKDTNCNKRFSKMGKFYCLCVNSVISDYNMLHFGSFYLIRY
ncbi:hypothetical protein RIR_jg12338.t1 [Rhizophagus irregularis DAOM 181602=DAOM 197198]|nr:hypothetical protein RIR_jg12338.t1 [Rhizophagus irregularis DAOM 181602=DAOM 197198]